VILRLKRGLGAAAVARLRRLLAGLLPGAEISVRRDALLAAAPEPGLLSARLAVIENLPEVISAELTLAESCPLAVSAPPPDLSVLRGGGKPGGFIVIAGPCAVEGGDAYLSAARRLKAAGATALRAALYKPRTSPYAFQGIGAKGGGIVRKARRAAKLPAVTEVTAESQLPSLKRVCDIIQIGARNMRNYELLKAAAAAGLPVVLKRAPGASLKDWLLSAEYLLRYGNGEVLLCERGDSFSRPDRRGLNLGILRAALAATALPVIADPSHATGDRALVAEQAVAAVKAGADGLMIEASISPSSAVMDGRQTLSIPEFSSLLKRIKKLR